MDANIRDILLLTRRSFEKIRDASKVTAELLSEYGDDDERAKEACRKQNEILVIADNGAEELQDIA